MVNRISDPALMYPYDDNDLLNTVNSMKQFHDQPLQFRLPFFGFAYHYIWVIPEFLSVMELKFTTKICIFRSIKMAMLASIVV